MKENSFCSVFFSILFLTDIETVKEEFREAEKVGLIERVLLNKEDKPAFGEWGN